MKKLIFSGIAILVLSLTLFTASSFGFSDENGFASWFKSAAKKMEYNGVMKGYPDGSFKAEGYVNRGELAVMFNRFATLMGKELREEAVVCTMDYRYGLTVHVYAENGQPLENVKITAKKNNSNEEVTFEAGQAGVYPGLGEAEGYYTFTAEKENFTTHVETVKLEKDECHVIQQTRTITLIKKA